MLKTLFTGRQLWVTLLVIVGALLLCRLGIWQLDRLAQRRAQNAQIQARMAEPPLQLGGAPIDPAALEYRPVELRGVYDPAHEVLLRNRALDGVPGVHVLTPLRISGSDQAVLVDRGWLPLARSAPDQRHAYDEPGEVTVRGLARRTQEYAGGPADPPLGPDRPRLDAWFRVDIARIQQQTDAPLLPIYVEQQPAPGDPQLPRREASIDLSEGPHLSYALQWFSFAIILLGGYVGLMRQQQRRRLAAAPAA